MGVSVIFKSPAKNRLITPLIRNSGIFQNIVGNTNNSVKNRFLLNRATSVRHVFNNSFFSGDKGKQAPLTSKVQEDTSIGQAIVDFRRKRRWNNIKFGIFGTFVGIFGYFVVYKVFYKGEETFLPISPASKVRNLSYSDLERLDTEQIESMVGIKVLEHLSRHPMIKEEYGVPLYTTDGKQLVMEDFNVWCEDQDPCIFGLLLKSDKKEEKEKNSKHTWHRIPFILKWRFTYRPVFLAQDLTNLFQQLSGQYNDIFQIISPEQMYGAFKYEYPIHGDNHSMHVIFSGEIPLNKNSLVLFQGKYHVDVKFDEICLIRREGDELVKYILYEEKN